MLEPGVEFEALGETLYLADGTKLAMLDGTSSGIKYVGSFRYDASEPDFIDVAVAGGRAVPTVNGWAVRYFTTDHLGSIRLVTDASGTVVSQNDYLPYGKKCWNTGLANQYKSDYLYGGKESTEIFGIEGYDSVARWQTTSGVFSSPDPLMEKYYPISPYAYCAGNPVNNIDPSGADNWDKVAGALIGVFTDIAPGTGFIRDLYRPSSSSDYNNALRKADVLSATVGCSMLTGGGTIAAVGASTTVSGAMAMATVVAAPEGAAVATGGAAVSTVGEVVASTGVMMMANAAINAGKGYKRGHQDIESASNTSKSNNKELGQSEVPIPEGYRKTRFQSHGKSVYTNGKYFISRDADSHNGGIWKKAKSIKELQSRKTRMGTYDINLNRIGD